MSFLYAILLGLIQGLTEFLPISSTAHLTLAGKLLGLIDQEHPETWTSFIAVMQLGSLAAVIMYFFKDVSGMIKGLVHDFVRTGPERDAYSRESMLAIYVIVGTLPVAFCGLLFSRFIHGMLTKSTLVIIVSLVTLAAVLWFAEKIARHARTVDDIRFKDAVLIGVAQTVALIPGASRSGTTITAGLLLNFTREAAARFSFLLSMPAIFASGVYEMTKIHPSVFQLGISNLVVSTLVAGVSSYAAISWLLKYLMKNTTMVFVWYRFALGLALAVMLFFGIINA